SDARPTTYLASDARPTTYLASDARPTTYLASDARPITRDSYVFGGVSEPPKKRTKTVPSFFWKMPMSIAPSSSIMCVLRKLPHFEPPNVPLESAARSVGVDHTRSSCPAWYRINVMTYGLQSPEPPVSTLIVSPPAS